MRNTSYLGRRTAWERILDPEGEKTPLHYHSCPECYKDVPCRMECALKPDLDRDDGTPRGSYCVCANCNRPHVKFPGGRIFTDTSSGTTDPTIYQQLVIYRA
jgi:hypothetical protein